MFGRLELQNSAPRSRGSDIAELQHPPLRSSCVRDVLKALHEPPRQRATPALRAKQRTSSAALGDPVDRVQKEAHASKSTRPEINLIITEILLEILIPIDGFSNLRLSGFAPGAEPSAPMMQPEWTFSPPRFALRRTPLSNASTAHARPRAEGSDCGRYQLTTASYLPIAISRA